MTTTIDARRGGAAIASARDASAVRWRAAFAARAAALPGASSWLAGMRREALARFIEEGWPSNRLENWRHTSLVFLNDLAFEPAGAPMDATLASLHALVAALRQDQAPGAGDTSTGAAPGVSTGAPAADDGHWLVFVDGHHVPALSAVGNLPEGASLRTLARLSPAELDRLEPLFGDPRDGEVHEALNTAFASDGAVLQLERGVVLAGPLHLVFIAATPGTSSHPRNLVAAAAGAQASVVEHYVGAAGEADAQPTLTNVVTRLQVDADARVTHMKLQEEAPTAIHLAVVAASQARGARFESHSVSLGARLARHDIGTRLDGEGSEALLNGLFHVDARRHVDHHTRIDHLTPRGTSHEFYRGILDDAGRGVFTGRIVVAPGAVRTDAVQRIDSLVLSPGAQTDARPELEIYADDVKCAHGATVGQIDDAALFYLRSRGLDEAYARNILTYAFAAEALARIGLAPLRRRAAAAIRARLPGGDTMETIS